MMVALAAIIKLNYFLKLGFDRGVTRADGDLAVDEVPGEL